jgi:hypothetical protein
MFKEYASQIAVGIFGLIWFGVGIYFLMSQPKHGVVVYDCSMAEISPDYPIKVKEECRKVQSGRI